MAALSMTDHTFVMYLLMNELLQTGPVLLIQASNVASEVGEFAFRHGSCACGPSGVLPKEGGANQG
jgi:hypothetical protein